MNTPVLLILFNRADTALQVLERIKLVGVKKLYLFSDGPRSSKIEESETLKKVQSEILNAINWDCEIKTKFEEENKGPRYAIGNGINSVMKPGGRQKFIVFLGFLLLKKLPFLSLWNRSIQRIEPGYYKT